MGMVLFTVYPISPKKITKNEMCPVLPELLPSLMYHRTSLHMLELAALRFSIKIIKASLKEKSVMLSILSVKQSTDESRFPLLSVVVGLLWKASK